MVIALVAAAWRRYAVTRLALAQWAHLQGELAGRGIEARPVIVADDDNLDIARGYGFDTVEQSNDFLGRKVNDGIQHACAQGADYVMVLGSDDWVHADLLADLPRTVARQPELTDENTVVFWSKAPEALTGRDIAVVDLHAGRMRRCHMERAQGVIPWVFPRAALRPSRFRPVKETINRGVDGSLASGLRISPNWIFRDPHDVCRVDFKTDVNITPYKGLTRTLGVGPELDPWAALAKHYPADLVHLARETHLELAR